MRPGEVVPCQWEWMEGDIYGLRHGYAVVLSTSRHKRTLTVEEGETLLGKNVFDLNVMTWRSHTKQYMEDFGCYDGCDGVGSFCGDGDGSAWVEVLYGRERGEL